MTAKVLANLHALAIETPAPWSENDFNDILTTPGTFLCLLNSSGQKFPGGTRTGNPPTPTATRDCTDQILRAFALGRTMFDEAELLTIAVHPDHRRQGLARSCLNTFETMAISKGAARAFLEVAENNAGARALYASAGWAEDGIRTNYYRTSNGRTNAILMSKTLNSG